MKKILIFSVACFFAIRLCAQEKISKQDIFSTTKLFDITFSQQEVDSMFDGVQDNANNYARLHKLHLDNNVPMSLWQSPVLPGMKFSGKQEPVDWNIPANVALPADKNDLAFYSVVQLASLIKNKKITSVELTKFFIDRLKKFGDTLQCIISLQENIALQQAAQADKEIAAGKYKGVLHGIPYGLKDLFAVKGTKTTWGAAPFKDQVIDEDAYIYTKLKDAGAVFVVKFTMGALAMGDKWYGGITKNPWNTKYGSSGSSAGSASATAAGLIPFAIGTETWGSIVSPSTTCGATGLRPTFGSVSRTGAMTLSWSLDKIGPITRSAEDAAIVFNAIHGADGKDLSAVNMPFNYKTNQNIKKLHIGYARNYFNNIKDTASNEWQALNVFRKQGIELIPVDLPDSNEANCNIMHIIIDAECGAAFDDFTRSHLADELTWQTKEDWPNQFRTAQLTPAVAYINANRHRFLLMQKMQEIMNKVDVVICPTENSGNQDAVTNLTGNPVVCVPVGFNKKQLPMSITFIGKLYGEAAILEAAKWYQLHSEWANMHPPMFK
ncbi:MAG: amidase [Chitinophagaceae bacterium]|jgi:Asp-tRNA(Asn)/Glu-tRNA(Gln) amidotransferase A subunit family amidase|nr:amidase [Chitinophagaceae bacterium]